MSRDTARSPLMDRSGNAEASARDADDGRVGARAVGRGDGAGKTTPGKSPLATARGGEENTPPVSARTRSRRREEDSVGASARADALSSKLLNSPSATARAEDIGRAYATKAASRGSAGKTRLGETPRSASASDWREEVQRTREKLARSRELSSEPTPSASASEGARLDVLEDEDGEAVVEALDARLLATVETEREETSPSSALVAETREQSAELRAAVEELRNEAKARERVDEDASEKEDEEEASEDEPACVTPNVDDPQVAMAIERTRLLEERKTKEISRKLVSANENAARLKARVHELELNLDEKREVLEANERRVQESVKEAVREVWAKMDAANTQCVKAETERCAAQAETQELRRRVIELETRAQQMEKALCESRANEKRAEDDMAKLKELAASADEIESEALRCELESAREEIARLEAALNEIKETANEKVYFQTENERLEAEVEELKREVSWRKAGEAELRSALERSEGEIVLHRAENSKAESDVYAMIEAKNTEIDELRRSLGDAERRLVSNEASMARSTAELATLRSQNEELTGAVQGMSTSGSSKTYELERDLATAMVNIQDLTSALEGVQYELKQAQVEKERASVEAQDAKQSAAEAASREQYKLVDLTTELENALEHSAHLQRETTALREREQDLLSQLDDAVIAARLADEDTELEIEDVSESEDPLSPSPVKNTRERSSTSSSRKMNVSSLVATNRDLVDITSRQANEIGRLQAERSKLRAEFAKSEGTVARLTKIKDDNYALVCKYKANLQKTSDEIKARQLVESHLREYEYKARELEHVVEELRAELEHAQRRERESARAATESSVVDELRKELIDMKQSLAAVRSEKKTMLDELGARLEEITASRPAPEDAPPSRDDEPHESSFVEFLAQEARDAETALKTNDVYAQRLQDEIKQVEREMYARPRDAEPPTHDAERVVETAKEAASVALSACESTKQRALYYKGVAKMVYVKLQSQKRAYDRRLGELKEKLDAATSAPETPSLRTPLSAIAREHSFLLDSA